MISQRSPRRLVRYGWVLAAVVVLAIGARTWWFWPKDLEPGPLLASASLRGSDYRFVPKASTATVTLINSTLFEGYSPDRHFDFEEVVKTRPSRYVRVDAHHHYVEYLGRSGRIQLHSAYARESGIDHWFVFFPTNLAVDAFFAPDIAILVAPEKPQYTVYIPNA